MTTSKQSQDGTADKTLRVSGIFFAHHQEFSTVHSALVSFMQVFLMTASKQSQDGIADKTLHVSGKEDARNM
jgi:hypothetical protein